MSEDFITTQADFLPVKKITPRQRQILQLLKDGEELVYEKRGGCWVDLEKTNTRLLEQLIRYCCVSQDSIDKDVEHWSINETGEMTLREGMFFIHRDFLKK